MRLMFLSLIALNMPKLNGPHFLVAKQLHCRSPKTSKKQVKDASLDASVVLSERVRFIVGSPVVRSLTRNLRERAIKERTTENQITAGRGFTMILQTH